MGFFSWNCQVCGHPMVCSDAPRHPKWFERVVVIEADGTVLRGEYDGYGRVDGVRFYEDISGGEPCCYHEACYEAVGAKPEYVGPSQDSHNQGWFFSPGEYKGVPKPKALKKALKPKAKPTIEQTFQKLVKVLGADGIERDRSMVRVQLNVDGEPSNWMDSFADIEARLEIKRDDDGSAARSRVMFIDVKATMRNVTRCNADEVQKVATAAATVAKLAAKATKVAKGLVWDFDEVDAYFADIQAAKEQKTVPLDITEA